MIHYLSGGCDSITHLTVDVVQLYGNVRIQCLATKVIWRITPLFVIIKVCEFSQR